MAEYGLTLTGPEPKRLDVILDEMHESLSERLGVNTRQNPQSLLNHLLTNIADQIAELWEYGTDVYYSQYISSAEGTSLDNAAQYGGASRELPQKSYYHILCIGQDGTRLPAGILIGSNTQPQTVLTLPNEAMIARDRFNTALVQLAEADTTSAISIALNGTLYTTEPDAEKSAEENMKALADKITDKGFKVSMDGEMIEITAADVISNNSMVLSENLTTARVGSVVTFATVEDGDILVPNGVVNQIIKAVPGLEYVSNVGPYIAGQLAETDAEFRLSYTDKIFNRSSAMLESIKSAILQNVQGVKSISVYENDTNEVDDMGRYPHSVEVVVDGGDENEIAQQILNTKAGGISTFGSIEKVLPGIYGESITIRFNRPTYVYVWFKVSVTMSKTTNPPTNYVELIKQQIMARMSALEAGDSVIPQKFNIQVSGVDYLDIWLFSATEAGTMPEETYDKRVVTITAREKAMTDDSRIEVALVE